MVPLNKTLLEPVNKQLPEPVIPRPIGQDPEALKENATTKASSIASQVVSNKETQEAPPSPLIQPVRVVVSSLETRLWLVFFHKILEEFDNYKDDPAGFKSFLTLQLTSFLKQIESRNSPQTSLLKEFLNDLTYKSLAEIQFKYFDKKSLIKGIFPFLENLATLFNTEKDSFSLSRLSEIERSKLRQFIGEECLMAQAMNRDPLMRLLATKKRETNPELNLFVIDYMEMEVILRHLSGLRNGKDSLRCQFLIRNEMHYTGLDIGIGNGLMLVAVIDPGGDKKCLEIADKTKVMGCDEIFLLGADDRIQFDRDKCAFFGFDFLVKSAKQADFFDLLKSLPAEESEGYKKLLWVSMPPKFVIHANSLSFLTKYFDARPDFKAQRDRKGRSFKDRIDVCVEERLIDGSQKKTNISIERKVRSYALLAVSAMASMSDEQLSIVVTSHSVHQFVLRYQLPN